MDGAFRWLETGVCPTDDYLRRQNETRMTHFFEQTHFGRRKIKNETPALVPALFDEWVAKEDDRHLHRETR